MLREPVPGVLCQVDGGWVLLDVGFNAPMLTDPDTAPGYEFADYVDELAGTEGDTVDEAFSRVGVDPGDVVAVGLSHLHYDHAGGLHRFAGRGPVHCQRRELDHARAGLARGEEVPGTRAVDYEGLGVAWQLADGDTEIAPGITAVLTAGHTAGHQSFVVDLPDGAGFVFAFDAADLQRNIDEELSPGGLYGDSPDVRAEAVESIRRLKSIAAARDYPLLPGHDPDAWPAFTTRMGVPGPASETRPRGTRRA
jgi:glyoxylase-like metal-dependent hydrolase (beta-lactamase superfamily II)